MTALRFKLPTLLSLIIAAASASASDFATEWISYQRGGDIPDDPITKDLYDDPTTALGPPTVDTTGDDKDQDEGGTGSPANAVPVVPVYPPFRWYEVVSVGPGGHLTLKFDHPVMDDPLNPCGIDFIVFGNARLVSTSGWTNQDPNGTKVIDAMFREPVRVSVSQDGVSWRTYADGPFADDFAPTLGRRYDPAHFDPTLPGNQWWGPPTDPTYPLDPRLTKAFFANWSVAQVAIKYGYSAGGTGFDLAELGLPWIEYVRFDNPVASGMSPEIDAVADVAARILPDFDCDSDVDDEDFSIFEDCATGPGLGPPAPGCERADLDQDGDVDQADHGIVQRCRTGPDGLVDPACVNGGAPW